MSVLDLRVLGDPVLRQETKPVATVNDELRGLIDDMFETMRHAKGIGLAAPQVGRLERITVIDCGESDVGPLALVNPEIVQREGTVKGEEGCLSIPDVYGDVERASRVVVRALDRDGKPFTIDTEGQPEILARCLQHEIDHLHGKLFIDHLSVLKKRVALEKWAGLKDRYPGNIRRLADEPATAHRTEEL